MVGVAQFTRTVNKSFAAEASVNATPKKRGIDAPAVPDGVNAEPLPAAEVPTKAPSEIAPPATNFDPPITRTSASCPAVGSFCKTPIAVSVSPVIAAAFPLESSFTKLY